MKYYKSLLTVLLCIIILSLLYTYIYKVNEKFADNISFSYDDKAQQETIIKNIILNQRESNTTPILLGVAPSINTLKCDGNVCLTNLTLNSDYPVPYSA
jgi:hypothetical protein